MKKYRTRRSLGSYKLIDDLPPQGVMLSGIGTWCKFHKVGPFMAWPSSHGSQVYGRQQSQWFCESPYGERSGGPHIGKCSGLHSRERRLPQWLHHCQCTCEFGRRHYCQSDWHWIRGALRQPIIWRLRRACQQRHTCALGNVDGNILSPGIMGCQYEHLFNSGRQNL